MVAVTTTRPSPTGSRVKTAGVATALAVTVVLGGAGLWLRALNGPLWPTLLTDWTLGTALLALSSGVVGAVLSTRVSRNVIGWLFLAQGLFTGFVQLMRELTTFALSTQPDAGGALITAWLFTSLIPLNMTVLALLALLFPHGSPPTPRWRPVVGAVTAIGVSAVIAAMVSPYSADQSQFAHLRNPVAVLSPGAGRIAVEATTLLLMAGWMVAVVGLVRRLRRAQGAERAQVKWFVFAAGLALGTFFPGFWIEPLFVFATLVGFPSIPLAAGVAVLRYRLYDIDRVINRTVVYAVVTGVLAVAYLAAVATIRAVTSPVTGDTAVSVAMSTLVVAALFRPLRHRIQLAVDRRFNRARYDAAATVDVLRLRLRDEVDLNAIKSDLLTVVYATMQPAGTALWLREAER